MFYQHFFLVFLFVKLFLHDDLLVGKSCPSILSNNGQLNLRFKVRLIKTWKNSIRSIGRKISVDKLLTIWKERYASISVKIVFIRVHCWEFISTFLQKWSWKNHKIGLSFRDEWFWVDDSLLEFVGLKIYFQLFKVSVLEVEGNLGQSKVLIFLENDVQIITYAAFADEWCSELSILLIKTHIKYLLKLSNTW